MDAISYSYADKQAKRIKKFINEPDLASGVVTVPKVIATGETVTIPAGRMAVLPNLQIDGTLDIQGDVFIPSGATFDGVVEKVASTDNAIARFNGTTGNIQNSGVTIDDAKGLYIPSVEGNTGLGVGIAPSSGINANFSKTFTSADASRYGTNNVIAVSPSAQITAARNWMGLANTAQTTYANTSAYRHTIYGIYNTSNEIKGGSTTSNSGNIYGCYNQAYANNTTDPVNSYISRMYGTQSYAIINTSTGFNHVDNMFGAHIRSYCNSTTNPNGASCTNSFGVYIDTANNNSGAIVNNYGLYQADNTASNVLRGTLEIGNGSTDYSKITGGQIDTLYDDGTTTYSTSTILGSIGTIKYPSAGGSTVGSVLDYTGLKLPNVNSESSTILDWYEEGTFTPTVEGSTTAGTYTSVYANGVYTRIGRVVTFNLKMAWSSHTGTGGLAIRGLPFVSLNKGTETYPVSCAFSSYTNTAGAVQAGVVPGTNYISFSTFVSNASNSPLPIDANATVYISGTYKV